MGRKQRYQQEGNWAGRHLCSGSTGSHERLSFCLSHFPRHNGQGLIVVIRVKILAFSGDFSQACIPGQSADNKSPRVVMFLRQAGSENNWIELMAMVILSKERFGGQKSDILTDLEVQGRRSLGSRVVDASRHGFRTEPTHLPPLTPQESVGRNQGSRGWLWTLILCWAST